MAWLAIMWLPSGYHGGQSEYDTFWTFEKILLDSQNHLPHHDLSLMSQNKRSNYQKRAEPLLVLLLHLLVDTRSHAPAGLPDNLSRDRHGGISLGHHAIRGWCSVCIARNMSSWCRVCPASTKSCVQFPVSPPKTLYLNQLCYLGDPSKLHWLTLRTGNLAEEWNNLMIILLL